jgi:hypothetical protein
MSIVLTLFQIPFVLPQVNGPNQRRPETACDLRSPAPLRKMSAEEKGSAVLGCNATVSV